MSSERRRRPPASRSEPLREQSYGGVVVRGDVADGSAEVAVIVPRGKEALALPKGGANANEAAEETAQREVREETGLITTIRMPLGDVTYWYRRSGQRVRKTVRFFLCDYVDGSTDDHDHEVTEARWIPLDEAPAVLTYPGERDIVAQAMRVLADSRHDR